MASNDTDIQLRIRAAVEGLAEISKLIAEVDTLGGETESSGEQVSGLGDELQRLGEQGATLTQFANLKRSTADLGDGLEQARARATGMGKALADAKQELTSSNAAYSASRQETERLAAAHVEAKAKVDLLRQANSEATTVTKEQRLALKDAREQVRLLGEQYKESSGQTNELKRGLESSEKALRQQTREFNSARREVQSLDTQYQRQNVTLNGLRRSLTDTGIDTRKLASEQKRVEAASQQAANQITYLKNQLTGQAGALRANASGLSEYSQKAKQAEQNTESLHHAVEDGEPGWAALATKIGGVAAAYLTFDQLVARTTGMVRTADEIERLGVSLKSVEGSAAGGEKALAWLREFNEKTPFQLNEITTAFIKAKNFGLDPYNGVLQATADYTAKTAGTYQDLEGVITALGQAYTKGKLQAEEMNQLNERSVPAAQLLAKAMGKTTDGIIAMATAGKLGRAEIEQLIKAMGEDAAGASEAMSNTFSGIWSNFVEELNRVELAVADAGIFNYIKDELRSVTAQLKAAAADGSLAAWAREMSDSLKVAVVGLREFVEGLVEWRGAIALAVKAWATMKVVQWSTDLLKFADVLKTRVAPDARQAGAAMEEMAKKGNKVGGVLGGISLGTSAAYAALALLAYEGSKGLVQLAQDAGIWAAKMGEAGEVEQRVAEQSRAFFSQLQRQGMTTMAQFDEFKNIQILSAQEVVNLSAIERTAYEQRLQGHREYLTGQLQVQKALEASGLKAEAMQYQADAALASMRQGFTNLAAAVDLTSQVMDAKSRPAVLNLISSFDQLKAKGTETATSITTLFSSLKIGDPTSLQNLGLAFDSLKEQGKLTQTELDAGLRKSLQDMSLQDLEVLKVQAMAAFDTMQNGAVSTAQVTESVLAEKLRRLGLDYQALQTGIDAVGRATIDTFRAIATDVSATSLEIAAAMKAAVNKADTAQELEELRKIWVQLGQVGKLSAQEQARGLGFLDDKIKDTKRKAAEIGDGFNTAADKSKVAADTMKESLKGVQQEAQKTKSDVEDTMASINAMNSSSGRGEVTRTVNAGSFFYKSVDINQLRGNADALANTLAGVEDELARYSQKVKDIPAYSEWSKYYGEKFQKEMEALRIQLQKELSKAQQKEVDKSQTTSQQTNASPLKAQIQHDQRRPVSGKTVTIHLKTPSGDAQVQSDEENLDALLRLLKQQGLRS
ncbi:tape measure protein [Aeromonas aquatilis]